MNKLLTIIWIGFMTVLFDGCAENYNQQYDTFNDFNKVNQRNKGWFPAIINSDAYDLKNVSYLDSLTAFGSFNYVENNFYDSIFVSPKTKRIEFSLFEQKVNEHSNRKPNWLINWNTSSEHEFETIQRKGFYFCIQINEKKIYFVLYK